jgi:signal transduction histidine kinase
VSRRVGRLAWGLQARLTGSYVLVTLAVVVLVEAIVLGYQTPQLVNDAGLQAAVVATASTYAQKLTQRYPDGAVPSGTPLGDPAQQAQPGQAQLTPDAQELSIPAIPGQVPSQDAVTAVVVVATDGTIVTSSAPARYRPGQPAEPLLPADAVTSISQRRPKNIGSGSTPFGSVSWALAGLFDNASMQTETNPVADVYVQAPQASGLVNPVEAWNELRRHSDTGAQLWASYVLLIAIVPAGALFGLLASRRMVRRVRRLEQATIAVATGDYSVDLPISGRDEIGRLEANFTTMSRQLDSALTGERQRASSDARAAERTRIAREIHDAISQHLFSLRMIAGGLRRANPDQEQAHAIERIAEEAVVDMQNLLYELRPANLERAGLVPALEEVCHAYRSRLGVEVDAQLDEVAVPAAVEHALLRITQEAFSNAVRHGKARRLSVSVVRADGHVQLAVRDTGTGFDPVQARRGSGLVHIRERVAELGGTVDIASTDGHGTAVTVRIPVP